MEEDIAAKYIVSNTSSLILLASGEAKGIPRIANKD
jgi:hypothetical protein